MRHAITLNWCLAVTLTALNVSAGATDIPLTLNANGGLEVDVMVADVQQPFLVDTGAALVTVNTSVYQQLRDAKRLTRVREVAARMADGRTKPLTVYSTDALQVTGTCEQNTVELIYIPGKGRNLLGMNVLREFAPLTFSMDPPSLSVSGCAEEQIANSASAL